MQNRGGTERVLNVIGYVTWYVRLSQGMSRSTTQTSGSINSCFLLQCFGANLGGGVVAKSAVFCIPYVTGYVTAVRSRPRNTGPCFAAHPYS